MEFIEVLKIIIIGIIEGITEWLPVSSTAHIMIFDHFFPLAVSDAFKDVFEYAIQLGAILAVVVVFWKRLFPWRKEQIGDEVKTRRITTDKEVLKTWIKVIIACVPAILAFAVDLLIDKLITTEKAEMLTISVTLIFYGVAFIVVEIYNKGKEPKMNSVGEITYKTALFIGLFQVLAAVPGTSRSGVTIIGALLLGVSRVAATEFTFFVAVPVMIGTSGYKILKFALGGNTVTGQEISALLLGALVAFAVSMLVIRLILNYIKKHDFKPFGYYRIALGVTLAIICLVTM